VKVWRPYFDRTVVDFTQRLGSTIFAITEASGRTAVFDGTNARVGGKVVDGWFNSTLQDVVPKALP
jgi:hypothetical protein